MIGRPSSERSEIRCLWHSLDENRVPELFRGGRVIRFLSLERGNVPVIDRSPSDVQKTNNMSNSTTVFANEAEGWVLVADSDS
jgi:hypothetical protein